MSATSIAYNVSGGPAHLNLDGKTIARIFLGQITNWNDAAIKALNKGANLPDQKITDTIPLTESRRWDKLTILPIAPLLARAIHEVFEDGSVTSMFGGDA